MERVDYVERVMSDDDIYAYIGALQKDIRFLNEKIAKLEAPKPEIKPDLSLVWFSIFFVFLMVMTK